jgi:hypothetical protein
MKTLNRFVLILITLAFINTNFSQAEESEPEFTSFKDRLYTGGNLSLNFGTITYIDVSPILGYKITEDFSVGAGIKYVYIGYNTAPRTSTSMYGGSWFTRHLFLENFLAHAEFEAISLKTREPFTGKIKREIVPIALVGGGYKQSLGGSSYLQIMLLYDLIGDNNSPYAGTSPFGIQSRLYVRGGITIGF